LDLHDSWKAPSADGEGPVAPPTLTARVWGVRGSVPDPGPHSVRYGGNTSCVEVMAGRDRIILDAGTGIRALGEALKGEEAGDEIVILLTHFHWDHIQGLPFFAPAYQEGTSLRIVGPEQKEGGVGRLLRGQMKSPYFPVGVEDLPASFVYSEMGEGIWTQGAFRIHAMQVSHPSMTFGYRLEAGGHSLVFVPDNELGGEGQAMPPGWMDRFVEFVRGAEVLLHDAMFTEAERPGFEGWGHSTCEQVVELATRAEVERAFFFHHAPGRADEEIEGILRRLQEKLPASGTGPVLQMAAEGMEILVGSAGSPPSENTAKQGRVGS